MTDNDVLLHAFQRIALGVDGGFCENLGGLLERCSTDKRLGLQRGTCDTLQHLTAGGRTCIAHADQLLILAAQGRILVAQFACGDYLTNAKCGAVASILNNLHTEDVVVDIVEVEFADQIALKEASIARIKDLDLAHHLAHDDLEVLVVDLHTLQTVNLLNLIDNILLNLHRAFNGKNISRSDCTVRKRSTCLDIVAVLCKNLLRGGDEVGTLLAGLGGDCNLTVAAFQFLGYGYDTIDFSHNCRVGRVTGLEQLGNTRQTARDIASLTERTRNLDHDITGTQFLSLFDTDMGTDR